MILLGPGMLKPRREATGDKPLIIGHRGSSYGVENTVEAMRAAIDAGAELLELDVRLSADGVPVVCHDSNLKRLSGVDADIESASYKELRNIQLSQNGYKSQILTLEQAIGEAKGRANLLVELKEAGPRGRLLTDRVMQVVEECEYMGNCLFMSQCYDTVDYLMEAYPAAENGYCLFDAGGIGVDGLLQSGFDFVILEQQHATQRAIGAFSKAGIPVYVCTVNDENAIRQFINHGAAGVISDYPDLAVQTIDGQYAAK